MKKSLLIVLLGVMAGVVSCSFTSKVEANPDRNKLLIDLISFVLEKAHYDAREINDDFSEEVFNQYIKSLDPQKRYFYKEDIEEFNQYKDLIDDQIKNKDLSFFELTNNRMQQRINETKNLYKNLLKKPFNFEKKDSIDTDYEVLSYVSSKKQMRNRWYKRLKFSTLGTYYDKIEEQNQNLENDPKTEILTKKELEAESREITRTSINEYFDFTDDLDVKDWFSLYINSIVETFDPHTYYFAPQDKDRFDISMSGKLEGIGARLQKKNDNIKIVEVISGGPAWRGEEVEVGDVILKVKQEEEQEPVSIVGMRLDDAVSLIKGPKGTKVSLTIRRVDGSIEIIDIIRDVVELEETYAKSSLINDEGKTYGLINLPKFYFNLDDYKERNAAIDVEKEIVRLKEKNINGLVIDLRNNGGGSLKTVVEIAGLFIKKGPVVQVKAKESDADVLKDTDSSIAWDGPLVIMVNELSASASEILAAAMQDYQRAIIIGSKQTYGKGTVQNVMDLNRWLRSNEVGDLGALKITTSKFYRVNGGSTQLEGVKSDIVVPDRYSYIDIGEKDQENPLKWDKIEPADYKLWGKLADYKSIIKRSQQRIKGNPQIQLIEDNAKWVSQRRDENKFPLSYQNYKQEIDNNESKIKFFEKIEDYESDLKFGSLPYEIKQIEKDTVLGEKRKRWHKNLMHDVYVEEAVNVLADINTVQAGVELGALDIENN